MSYNPVTCGECSLCCKLMSVNAIDKPANKWCKHCTKPGCGIYEERPEPCRTFRCLWLVSHESDGLAFGLKPMPLDYKPSVCGAVMTMDEKAEGLVVHMNEGAQWNQGLLGKFIDKVSRVPRQVIIIEGLKRTIIVEGQIVSTWRGNGEDQAA